MSACSRASASSFRRTSDPTIPYGFAVEPHPETTDAINHQPLERGGGPARGGIQDVPKGLKPGGSSAGPSRSGQDPGEHDGMAIARRPSGSRATKHWAGYRRCWSGTSIGLLLRGEEPNSVH